MLVMLSLAASLFYICKHFFLFSLAKRTCNNLIQENSYVTLMTQSCDTNSDTLIAVVKFSFNHA